MLLKRRAVATFGEAEEVDGMVERPLDSKSNTRTSESPAHVTTVRSSECGMNLTENMFAE